MPYILLKKDGVRQTAPFVFTEDEVYNLSLDREHRYVVQNTTTFRSKTVGGGGGGAIPRQAVRLSRTERHILARIHNGGLETIGGVPVKIIDALTSKGFMDRHGLTEQGVIAARTASEEEHARVVGTAGSTPRLMDVEDTHGQVVSCFRCRKRVPLAECKADLDGPAFRAYYCRLCQKSMGSR